MKKFLTVILMLVISVAASAEDTKLDGVWKSGNVELTFIGDTLYMDDIDIEGFQYIYSFDQKTNVVKAVSPVFDTDVILIKIVMLTKNAISLYFMDDEAKTVYKFHRKKVQVPTLGF
jgi:hypothetical protein